MAKKQRKEKKVKEIYIRLEEERNVFNRLIKPIIYNPKENTRLEAPLSQIKEIKQLLNKEKIKIIYAIKEKKPKSIYELAKLLGRNFKAVRQDLKLLEKLGIIELKPEKIKNRSCSRPILKLDKINFLIEL